jgi:hypothetical protein
MTRHRRPRDGRNYEVGYGKPPVATRFKKGTTGNPRGRKAGKPNIKTSIEEGLTQTRMVTVDGLARPMSAIEIIMRKQIEKAIGGDTKATLALIELVRELSPRLLEDVASRSLTDSDQKIIDQFARQLGVTKLTATHSHPPALPKKRDEEA